MRRFLLGSSLILLAATLTPRRASAEAPKDCALEECTDPRVIPAESGQAPPPGYRREQPMNVPLVVGGVAAASVGTVLLASGIANALEEKGSHESSGPGDGLVIGAGGVTLAAGVGLILWGTLGAPTVFVRNSRVSFTPLLDRAGPGGAIAVTF